jgi:hypothetical protein
MTKLALAAIAAAIASTAALTIGADPAGAWGRDRCCSRGWHREYQGWDPQVEFNRRYWSGVRRYRSGVRGYRANPCGYGDCACIRGYAVATGAQVWWDRYQACTGR